MGTVDGKLYCWFVGRKMGGGRKGAELGRGRARPVRGPSLVRKADRSLLSFLPAK